MSTIKSLCRHVLELIKSIINYISFWITGTIIIFKEDQPKGNSDTEESRQLWAEYDEDELGI